MRLRLLLLPLLPNTTTTTTVILTHTTLQQKRVASLRTRTVSTVAMIAGFVAIIYMGHVPLVFLVLTLQVCCVCVFFVYVWGSTKVWRGLVETVCLLPCVTAVVLKLWR